MTPTATATATATPTPSTGDVQGLIFWDRNRNAVFEAGDMPLSQAMVALKVGAGWTVATQTTAADGLYRFSDLTPMNYIVHADGPAGFVVASPEIILPVRANAALRVDFAAWLVPTETPTATPTITCTPTPLPTSTPTSTPSVTPTRSPTAPSPTPTPSVTPSTFAISGQVWLDLDGDGAIGELEPGIPGAKIRLLLDEDGNSLLFDSDTELARAVSGPDGTYLITPVRLGTYLLVLERLPNHFAVTASRVVVHHHRGGETVVVHFGNRPYWRSFLTFLRW